MGRIGRGAFMVGALLIITARGAYADPVTLRGFFVMDHEEPAIDFDLSGIAAGVPFRLVTGAPDNLSLVPMPAGLTFACEPRCAPRSTFDFSNATDGLQPFGTGTLIIADALHSNVIFTGVVAFKSPGAILPGAPIDPENSAQNFPIISAPFTLTGTLIAQQSGGARLFSADVIGTGRVRTALRWNGIDAFRLDEGATFAYLFDAAQPTPEPGSLLLIGTGIVGALVGRRRTTGSRSATV
jgi:hypothetical protein